MLPGFSLTSLIYGAFGDRKFHRHLPRASTGSDGGCSNFDDLCLRQDGAPVALALNHSPVSYLVLVILFACFPGEIAGDVAVFLSVFVSGLMFRCGRLAVEGATDQNRNTSTFDVAFVDEVHDKIPIGIWKGLQDRAGRTTFYQTFSFRVGLVKRDTAAHTTEAAYLVVSPIGNGAPLLGNVVRRHIAGFLRLFDRKCRRVAAGLSASLFYFAVAVCATAPGADAQISLTGAGSGGAVTAGATYQGPLDVVPGAIAWYGLRGASAAYAAPGTGKSVNVRRASDNSTQDIVILSNGNFDVASYNTFVGTDATGTCTIATTTLSCTGLGSALHNADLITGTGISNPCILSSVGSLVGGAQTATAQIAGTSTSCGTVSVGETVVAQVAGFVPTLYDQSGNTKNATQATAGTQLQILPSALNSKPGIFVSGSTYATLAIGGTTAQPYSYSAVAQRSANFSADSSIFASNLFGIFFHTANVASTYSGALCSGTASDSTHHALQALASGASSFINIDGSDTSCNPSTSAAPSAIGIGAHSDGTSILTGDIEEVGFWASGFSAGNRTSLQLNQKAYWGTP